MSFSRLQALRNPCWDLAAGGTCSTRAGASCPSAPAAPALRGPRHCTFAGSGLQYVGLRLVLRRLALCLGDAPQPLQILASILNGQE